MSKIRISKIIKKQSRKLAFFPDMIYHRFIVYSLSLPMFKKIILLSACIILSGCGNTTLSPELPISEKIPVSVESFESSYLRIMRNTLSMTSSGMIEIVNNFYSSLYPSGYDTSLIRIAFDVPTQTSGDLSISADAVRETYKKLSAKMSLSGSVKNIRGEILEFRDVR